MLHNCQAAWLRHDLVAGLVLTAMLVPVGIAYAEASGVPGIYGLYATIVPLLAYAVFGPSRILVLGPDSVLAAVILAVSLPLAHGDPMRAVTLAAAMAVVSGVVCIAAGPARLGFVTEAAVEAHPLRRQERHRDRHRDRRDRIPLGRLAALLGRAGTG
jgi:MFS superfamily sulfate permease-like transporter